MEINKWQVTLVRSNEQERNEIPKIWYCKLLPGYNIQTASEGFELGKIDGTEEAVILHVRQNFLFFEGRPYRKSVNCVIII